MVALGFAIVSVLPGFLRAATMPPEVIVPIVNHLRSDLHLRLVRDIWN